MTSNFEWKGEKYDLKADTVTPEMLKSIFGIDQKMLIDKEGNVHFPKGDKFVPLLTSEKFYIVHEVPSPANEKPDDNQVVALMKNAKENLQLSVSKNTFVTENTGLLLNSIHAPFLIDFIAVLSCLGPDPSLISKNMSEDKFKELKSPGSFRSSLCQIACSTCSAYRNAHSAMNTIKTLLKDLPEYFVRIFEMISDPNLNENGQKSLRNQLSQVNNANEECKKKANSAHQGILGVLKELNEMHQASLALKSANASEIQENEKRRIVLSMEQNDRNLAAVKLEKEVAEANASRDNAKQIHQQQIQSNDVMLNIFTATVAEGALDYLNSGGTKEVVKFASKVLGENVLNLGTAIANEINTDSITKEIGMLQALDIGSAASLKTQENITSKIAHLKEFEKNVLSTPEGFTVKKKVAEFREKLENNGSQLSNESLNTAIQEIQNSISSAISIQSKSLQEKQMQQSKNKEAQLSLHQQIVKSDAEKTQTTQKFYEKECEQAEKIRKECAENTERLRNIICELQNIKVSADDLSGCIKFLEKALNYMSDIEKNWSSLERFFDEISVCVADCLYRHVKEFGQHVDDNYSRKNMLASAMDAMACIIQVMNCAEIYIATSNTLIMPIIGNISNQLNLSPEQATVKQAEIQVKLNEAQRDMQELVDCKQREFNDKVTKQIEDFVKDIKMIVHASRQIGS